MDADCMQQLQFRPLQAEDTDELKVLHAELFPIDYDDIFFEKAVSSTDRLFSYAAVHHSSSGQQRLIGFITARLMYAYECDPLDRHYLGFSSPALASTPMVYILTLGVTKPWQGRGIARMLLQQVHSHAQAMRWKAVFLHVITYNHSAIKLYTGQSYRCLACLRDFYTISTGRQLDPQRTTYDAYLYGVLLPDAQQQSDSNALQWHGEAAWCMAMAPLRNVLGHFNTCMPWLCNQGSPWMAPGMGVHNRTGMRESAYFTSAEPRVNAFSRNNSGTLDKVHQDAPFGLPGPYQGEDTQAWEQSSTLMYRRMQAGQSTGPHHRPVTQQRGNGSHAASEDDWAVNTSTSQGVNSNGHAYSMVDMSSSHGSHAVGQGYMPVQACSQQAYSQSTSLQQGVPSRRPAPGSQSLLQWLAQPSR